MTRTPCPEPNKEGCPYQNRRGGCFGDTDHLVPQRFRKMGWLIDKYIDTPYNKETVCRFEHEEKTAHESVADIPSAEHMLTAVYVSALSGELPMSNRDNDRLRAVLASMGLVDGIS